MTKEELKIGGYYHINHENHPRNNWCMIVKVTGMNPGDKDRVEGFSIDSNDIFHHSESTPYISDRSGHPASALEIAWLDKCIKDGKFSPCPKEINFDDYLITY